MLLLFAFHTYVISMGSIIFLGEMWLDWNNGSLLAFWWKDRVVFRYLFSVFTPVKRYNRERHLAGVSNTHSSMRWPFLLSEHSCFCQGIFLSKIIYLVRHNFCIFFSFNMCILLYMYRQWKNRSELELKSSFDSLKKRFYSQSLKLFS